LALASLTDQIEVVTYPAEMGEMEARQAGFEPQVIGQIIPDRTTAEDTRRAGAEMAALGVNLLLFAGGDGTARNVYEAIGLSIPALGIPAGVKIHSGVYATTPDRAAQLAAMVLKGNVRAYGELEVMDIDEEAFRQGRVSARLFGYLKVPLERRFTQGVKAASSNSEHEAKVIQSIAEQIVENMEANVLYVIGSGTTPRAVMELLGLPNTLLGIDAVLDGKLVAADLNETRLLELIGDRKSRIIVTPIGGQGYIFGRGNQQLSPEVLRKSGIENIIVAATPGKLASLQRRPLLVDTGDKAVDEMLKGYVRVITGYREEMVYKIS
jgi:predicted polyphosphate/ATP-dependent NAD kinase